MIDAPDVPGKSASKKPAYQRHQRLEAAKCDGNRQALSFVHFSHRKAFTDRDRQGIHRQTDTQEKNLQHIHKLPPYTLHKIATKYQHADILISVAFHRVIHFIHNQNVNRTEFLLWKSPVINSYPQYFSTYQIGVKKIRLLHKACKINAYSLHARVSFFKICQELLQLSTSTVDKTLCSSGIVDRSHQRDANYSLTHTFSVEFTSSIKTFFPKVNTRACTLLRAR